MMRLNIPPARELSDGILLFDLPDVPFADQLYLDAEERREAGRFVRPLDRSRYCWRRALSRVHIAERLSLAPEELEFFANEHGKPLVEGCSFNISWVENAMVLILGSADSALGIDLEHRKRFLSALGNHQKQERLRQTAREFCTTEEQAWLDEQEVRGGPEGWLLGFGRIWTRKESLIKAWGQSIGSHALLASLEGDRPPAIRWGNSDWLSREDCPGAYLLCWTRQVPQNFASLESPIRI